MKLYITISGKAKAGKTLTANILKDELEKYGNKVAIVPFAGYLKYIAKQYYGWNGSKDEQSRTLLQQLGTEKVRPRHPNFWVDTVREFIEVFGNDFDYIISDDCRFGNEIEFSSHYNISHLSIKVNRVNYDSGLTEIQKNHPSERALDNYKFNVYLEAETGKENLEREVRTKLFLSPDYRHLFE